MPTKEQLTNVFTEAVSNKALCDSLNKLGIPDLYASTWGEYVLAWVKHSNLGVTF